MSKPDAQWPELIPVLDLRRGVVVHAVAGDRARYAPLALSAATSSEPLEVARALRRRWGLHRLYVADLDGILDRRPHFDRLAELAADGFALAVDAGVRSLGDALALTAHGVGRVILGLETTDGPRLVRDCLATFGPERATFSLDLREGRPLVTERSEWQGQSAEAIADEVVGCGVRSLLALDLRSVGGAAGLSTLPLCRRLRAAHPEIDLWTGGGVRDAADVAAAGAAGIDRLLVATALHAGRLDSLLPAPARG